VDEEGAFRIFKGFRKMLEKEKSIDAVVITTPDHTHALAADTET
jgi:predicted dehydrogenase